MKAGEWACVTLVWLAACAGSPWCTAAAGAEEAPAKQAARAQIRIRGFLPEKPLARARRPAAVAAVIENAGEAAAEVQAWLVLPKGVKTAGADAIAAARIEGRQEKTFVWQVEADQAGSCDLTLQVSVAGAAAGAATLTMQFLAPVEIRKLPYIPEPAPVPTPILIGAHHCPLWEADKPNMWANIRKHPERTPALGFYAQENPEVSDWETKWAVEHGISFFVYCWYRTSQGEAVKTQFSSAIHDALLKSKFVDKMKFTIMWENQNRGKAGVADEKDLLANLLAFWIENYFKHPSYLKIDNKPLLFIYRPEYLVEDLRGAENVAKALDRMRQACREAGFGGLYVLGEYRGLDPNHLRLMKQLGLDYTFAYCWHVGNSPTPEQAIGTQMDYIRKTQALHVMPQVVTVSQGWSGWADEGSIWKIPPQDYETLLAKAKDFIATLPRDQLGSRMLLLDNWNEWGEGHYIAPYREFGFGYVDAVRKVFSDAPAPHVDLIPEDIGLGPYDTAYRAHVQREEDLRRLVPKKVMKTGAPEQGLVGWWAFDEEPDSPAALDYSGNRLGGTLRGAARAKGIDGNALVCSGGAVVVEGNRRLSPVSALTIECWVKTDAAGQDNKWFVNRVLAGSTSSGYRMGVLEGKPCFEVPATSWSHHLKAAAPLPTGRWVHLVGTFDGKRMRIYVDGQEHGTMERPGPVNPTDCHLCLGAYDVNHPAHFTGLLDEVKIYGRALAAEEVREHYRRLADRAGVAPADLKQR